MYSRQEVAKHNSTKDAWVVYKGKVLDVTYFLETHPGGDEALVPYLGKDATEAFRATEHSYSAHHMINDLKIGYIEGEQPETEKGPVRSWDPSRGMIYQVWSQLSLKDYLDMVNNPTHFSGHARMFDSPFLEFFTKTKWYVIPIVWLPVVAYFFCSGLQFGNWTSVFFFFGLLIWTLVEYILHRFVFHSEIHIKKDNHLLTTAHFLSHGIHHAFPMDSLRLVFPPALSIVLSYIIKGTFNSIFPVWISDMAFSGTITGYIWYDVCHYYIHHHKTHFRFTEKLKKYHMYHHYRDPLLGFGVSNKLWDIVFRTELVVRPKVKSA